MIDLKKKDLKELAENKNIIDITYKQNIDDLFGKLDCIGISYGRYGKNGAMFVGSDDGRIYVVTERTSNLNRLI